MKILHTSDFNLGKRFFNRDRFPETKAVLSELVNIANERKPDVVLIAGNVFGGADDAPRFREVLCDALSKLAAGGKRAVVLIGGKNDSAAELKALVHLADKQGITVVSDVNFVPIKSNPLFLTKVTAAGRGYVEIVNESGETALISVVPYIGAESGEDLNDKAGGLLNGAPQEAKIKIALLANGLFDFSDEKREGKLQKSLFDSYSYVALGGAENGKDGKFFASGGIMDYDFSETPPSVIFAELDAEGLKYAESLPLASAKRSKNVIVSDFDLAKEELKKYKDRYTRLFVSSGKPVQRASSAALQEEFPLLAGIVFSGAAAVYSPPGFIDPRDGKVFAAYLEKIGAESGLAEIFGTITEER
ncbi:MAG: exonuclease subunit SbcD [Clostridiales bacterium]|nr:exonuclease subunit SbcD [Clostridiales bacterium]